MSFIIYIYIYIFLELTEIRLHFAQQLFLQVYLLETLKCFEIAKKKKKII